MDGASEINAPLLETRGLEKTFLTRLGGKVCALGGVSLTLRDGEDTAVVGPSGCGKTTLARVILGLVTPEAGEVLFEGVPVWGNPDRTRYFRRMVRAVFQDPFAALDPRFTVREALAEALHLEGRIDEAAREGRMREMLSAVSLPDSILDRRPHAFSGGERQRISIARALMSRPRLIILDEAVSSLDTLVRHGILRCLDDLRFRYGITCLFITHDLGAARVLCERTAVMNAGCIVKYGLTRELLPGPASRRPAA